MLPIEIWTEILIPVLPFVGKEIENTADAFKLRRVSTTFCLVIEKHIFAYVKTLGTRLVWSFSFDQFHLFKGVKELDFTNSHLVDDDSLCKMTWLTKLCLVDKVISVITKKGLSTLTNLTSLELQDPTKTQIKGFRHLPKLEELTLVSNRRVNDQILRSLTNLRALHLDTDHKITGRCFSSLSLLEELTLSGHTLTLELPALSRLAPRLSSLTIDSSTLPVTIDFDLAVMAMTRLTSLTLKGNGPIFDQLLMKLTSLTSLGLEEARFISNVGLSTHTQLQYLSINNCPQLNRFGMKPLAPSLTGIIITNSTIDLEAIECLPLLKNVWYTQKRRYGWDHNPYRRLVSRGVNVVWDCIGEDC